MGYLICFRNIDGEIGALKTRCIKVSQIDLAFSENVLS